ncbi:AfsR/SARP family transcriptional regulator [Actinokineospora spheciospongiae]|uniref:AfsR/SARP family transcriptional regulator n=1 Tax=Actinokineospora spheciospongiae TaxID=909613 RepID=UPI000557E180|nr:BTAD domain-containing putative transcriptional regulator [Actinokineospora spheciospongiae]
MAVRIGLLGEVGASAHGRPVDIGAAKQRCVLAALAVDLGRVVSDEQLVDRVWGVDPPSTSRKTLASYVSRLRTAFAGTGADIKRRSGGFVLLDEHVTVDLRRFNDLCARAASGDAEEAAELLTSALELWRGEALTGLDGEWAAEERDRLHRVRFGAECDLTDARLRLGGRDDALVAELSARVVEHPLDERVAGQFMRALHRDGRTADALNHYRRFRVRLVEELGVDPGAALTALHQRILTDGAEQPEARTAPAVPRQLPARPAPFAGRADALAALDAAVGGAEDGGVVVVAGTGGIGKTWLALHWAHRALDRFPDGQLFVDLRGFSPDQDPMAPQVALRGFLEALGTRADRVPTDPHGRTALFRSLVADKRMLLVLDNAVDSAQVVPLLPGGETCTVVVTSRGSLPGLLTAHRAHHLPLDALPDGEARRLLTARLGAARTAAAPEAVDEIVARCGGLPLALGIIAGRCRIRPLVPLADLATELREAGLDALDDDDPTASLPAVLSWSHRALTAEQAESFELLGTAPGADIGVPAAAGLLGVTPAEATAVLRGLAQASLIGVSAPGRYRMHDLLRQYAGERVRATSAADTAAAVDRLLDHYLHSACAAESVLATHRHPVDPGPPDPRSGPTTPADDEAAMRWFAAEHPNLLAIQRWAVERGRHDAVWQLAWALDTFHFRHGRMHDVLTCWTLGLRAAEQAGTTAAQAMAHRYLGQAHSRLAAHEDASRHLETSLALAEREQDPRGQADTRRVLVWTLGELGHTREALEHLDRLRHTYRDLGEPVLEADILNGMGWFHAQLGEYAEAETAADAALALFRAHDHRHGIADVSATLGRIAHHTGRYEEALGHYRAAIDAFRSLGDDYQVTEPLEGLGDTYAALHRTDLANAAWREALVAYREQGRTAEAEHLRRTRLPTEAPRTPQAI